MRLVMHWQISIRNYLMPVKIILLAWVKSWLEYSSVTQNSGMQVQEGTGN
ncbi:hypothetical protein NTGZN8_70003 [Candidatus Nitrotoga fabula]|uniref:Uncharacterized protein n=1 Tax=Candidatus Nitrotoga fabula TaxID=2182327 RepID=A0A916BHV3_9PROT|nr:hypothetical protein NTGZN8_70003 [Candidatus Nitrotoga fabula]